MSLAGWKQLVPDIALCVHLDQIFDFSWSKDVLVKKIVDINLSKRGLYDVDAVVLSAILVRNVETLLLLDLRLYNYTSIVQIIT